MAKPPANADPGMFIIGHGVYDNLRTARPYHDDQVFRIDPAQIPFWSLAFYNVLFVAFFAGFHWLIKHDAQGAAGPWLVYGAPIGIGAMTCVAFTLIVYHSFNKACRLGPWLVYDKTTRRVELPREGVAFDREEIVHLQYITTKRLDWDGVINNDRLSELNLITCRDGTRRRWPLLRSIFNVKAFDYMLKPLLENTDLPVMRVQDEWLGWEVTETPYSPCRQR